MRKFFAVALGSVVALAGFAGTANASATVDLIWLDLSAGTICLRPANRNCPRLGTTLSNLSVSDNITLLVLLTAGPNGSIGGSVSVDYTPTVPSYSVTGFRSFLSKPFLTLALGTTSDIPPFIDQINAGAAPPAGAGVGLLNGQSAYLGTVSFKKDTVANGTFELKVGTNGPSGLDGVADLNGTDISATTTYNSAYLLNVPEPGALSLLVMGVGGMLLAGRGRRS